MAKSKGKKIIREKAKPFIESVRLDDGGNLHIKLYNHWGLGVLDMYGSPDTHLILNPIFEEDKGLSPVVPEGIV